MSKYKKQKLFTKKRGKLYWKISLYSILSFSLIYGIIFWSSFESFQIKNVQVSGNIFTETEIVEEIFNNETDGRHLFLVSKNNYLFVPDKKIKKYIENELSVKEVFIKRENWNTVSIEIAEHKPFGIWCDGDDCYFVNDKGLFFAKVPEIYDPNLIVIEGEKEGDKLGQYFIEENIFSNFSQKVSLLKEIEIEVTRIYTEDFETFKFVTKDGPELFVEKNDDPVQTINNLETTINQEDINDAQFENLEYIDLRFDNKVFYKIK